MPRQDSLRADNAAQPQPESENEITALRATPKAYIGAALAWAFIGGLFVLGSIQGDFPGRLGRTIVFAALSAVALAHARQSLRFQIFWSWIGGLVFFLLGFAIAGLCDFSLVTDESVCRYKPSLPIHWKEEPLHAALSYLGLSAAVGVLTLVLTLAVPTVAAGLQALLKISQEKIMGFAFKLSLILLILAILGAGFVSFVTSDPDKWPAILVDVAKGLREIGTGGAN